MESAKNVAKMILGKKDEMEAPEAPEAEAEGLPTGLVECMTELQSALSAGDFEQAAKVFQSAFNVLEAAPHAEAAHEE